MNGLLARDERERSVDQAADRISYLVLSFGLLALVAYRGFLAYEASWDLLGLVIAAGLIGTAYRARERAVSRRWAGVMVATLVVAAVLAVAIGITLRS